MKYSSIGGAEATTDTPGHGSAWYRAPLGEFILAPGAEVLGKLAERSAWDGLDVRADQIDAWRIEVGCLSGAAQNWVARNPRAAQWTLLLEYVIPRRHRRIDAVILACGGIVVIEFKCGATSFDRGSRWQVEDYALDIRDFHAVSRGRPVAAILVATEATESAIEASPGLGAVFCVGAKGLFQTVASQATEWAELGLSDLNGDAWDRSPYRPTPSIVEAGQRLFAKQSVRELGLFHADNLGATVEALSTEVQRTRQDRARTICFVTGVPGAGKTLVGLVAVHDPVFASGLEGDAVFMSGNRPLVQVLREALLRDALRRGMTKRSQERLVRQAVQSVHAFIAEYGVKQPTAAPHEHVVVFDEAQRAWNAQKLGSKHKGLDRSEPAMMLDIMERAPDWCVVVALVGGGQEIHTGEAGLEEWGRALVGRTTPWRVLVSSAVTQGGDAVAQHRLFEQVPPPHLTVRENDSLHLSVSVRSPRAERLTEWVNALLRLDFNRANEVITSMQGFRLAYTRDLEEARSWLRDASESGLRPGLLASSGALRHRAHGLEMSPEFHRAYPISRWFLDPKGEITSSFQLEVAMREFDCQGLEVDLAGLCWGGDLTPNEDFSAWEPRTFNGRRWNAVRVASARGYALNKYRVLLTRAREGMVIWVPQGDRGDSTRDPMRFDRVAEALTRAGILPVRSPSKSPVIVGTEDTRWTRDELMAAYNLYARIALGRLHRTNPVVAAFARAVGRTPNAVAMKMANFAATDPAQMARGVHGLRHYAKSDKDVAAFFAADWSVAVIESQRVLEQLASQIGRSELDQYALMPEARAAGNGEALESLVFRQAVLASYDYRCAITGIQHPDLIIASDVLARLPRSGSSTHPCQGIALSLLHHQAFGRGIIGFDERLRVMVSRRSMTGRLAGTSFERAAFVDVDGVELALPARFSPNEAAVAWHREHIFQA